MRRLLAAVALAVILAAPSHVFGAESPHMLDIAVAIQKTTPGELVSIEGEVLFTFDNEKMMVRDRTGEMVVTIGPRFWDLGLQAGHRVRVSGALVTSQFPRNTLVAEQMTKLRGGSPHPQGHILARIDTVLHERRPGEIVAVVGSVDSVDGGVVTLSDRTGRIACHFDNPPGLGEIPPGSCRVVAAGKVIPCQSTMPNSRCLQLIHVTSVESIVLPGDDLQSRTLSSIMAERPVGQVVKTRGRLVTYIGEETHPVLYDCDETLVIHMAEKYRTLDVENGDDVFVVGRFEMERVKGVEVGVLRDARIGRDPNPLLRE